MRWYRQLHWQTLLAMIVGALVGLAFGESAASATGWIGDLFMKLLRMIIVPLVLTSIISGVASVDPNREDVPPEAVTLMTIHRSKGLEYQSVHLCSASEGMLPHALATKENEREGLEEERRLAFVAMSRAKERLTCWYYTTDEQGRETRKSQFLSEAGL